MNKRSIALLSGFAILIMAISGGFSLGFALAEFSNENQITSLKENIIFNQGLYKMMLAAIGITIVLDLVVSYSLYKFFQEEHQKIARLSGVLRLIYTLVFGLAAIYLLKNLNLDKSTNEMIEANYQCFNLIWNSGLIIFGFHIISIAYLMKLHQRIPRLLWNITMLAGFSYILIHVLKVINKNSQLVDSLELILAIPMIKGELGLAFWLIFKGAKSKN